MTQNMDFIIPIKKTGLFTRSVLEGIYLFYQPRRIIIITNKDDIDLLKIKMVEWCVKSYEFMDEDSYFLENFHLTIDDLKSEFQTIKDDPNHREFGWWFQQIIKLGASTQVKNISSNYVVWDGDLIPLKKWDLEDPDSINNYYVAILQDKSKNVFNKMEYDKCNHHLLGINCLFPLDEGTFVTHHMVFNVDYINEMFRFIREKNGIRVSWPLYIISLSKRFYRFSEYNLYSSFMIHFSKPFLYHPFHLYGKNGIRFREPAEIIREIALVKKRDNQDDLFTFQEICEFFSKNDFITYVQFEHVYTMNLSEWI